MAAKSKENNLIIKWPVTLLHFNITILANLKSKI